uniref:Uncharacterized protein n=1 Tax=Chromera velia CCMP2878 TaxID=1169474 RepID=A0A0G4FLI2_9ALVE|eukprot:Cvel_3503.t1-p1 / transcript=Cvel_3503.t1 / gene=Cvel_3503 / organism=Chromera_velia_CCMP2878 / gene_product=hypothetical protein / transcript_product=hypothetical protein / location=Cvel_scaffold141:121894-124430(-) / protein_length=197 / sequence_SO=supercontig / SO=protein_coding / is_pseudo=false
MVDEKVPLCVWFTAPPDLFSEVIDAGAKELNTSPFLAHVTAIGRVPHVSNSELLRTVEAVAALSAPFELETGDAVAGEQFFQCVYAGVSPGGGGDAAEAVHLELVKRLYVDKKEEYKGPNESYMPHLSLVYGDLAMEMKRAWAEKLNSVSSSDECPLRVKGRRWKVKTLDVVTADLSDVSSWKLVASFPLLGSQGGG